MPKWQRNGWRTVNGENVKNKADMEKLSNVCSKIDVKWVNLCAHLVNLIIIVINYYRPMFPGTME